MAENPFENLLTAKEIAQELGLSSPYVSTLLAGGAMPVLRHNGRVFVRRDDFETFVRSRRPRAQFIRGLSPATVEALLVLVEWREARVIELAIPHREGLRRLRLTPEKPKGAPGTGAPRSP